MFPEWTTCYCHHREEKECAVQEAVQLAIRSALERAQTETEKQVGLAREEAKLLHWQAGYCTGKQEVLVEVQRLTEQLEKAEQNCAETIAADKDKIGELERKVGGFSPWGRGGFFSMVRGRFSLCGTSRSSTTPSPRPGDPRRISWSRGRSSG